MNYSHNPFETFTHQNINNDLTRYTITLCIGYEKTQEIICLGDNSAMINFINIVQQIYNKPAQMRVICKRDFFTEDNKYMSEYIEYKNPLMR